MNNTKKTADKRGILKDPPQTLILQKKYVQQFPNNQKVVLYYSDALKRYFSFNYNKDGIELLESEFNMIEKLREIKEIECIFFFDGTELNVNDQCAKHILDLYEDLTEDKSEFEEYISESGTNFLNILDYSANKFKKETK